jgi:hypothetical protein
MDTRVPATPRLRRAFQCQAGEALAKTASPRMTQSVSQRLAQTRFVDSNSHGFSFPRRRASWAFSFSPPFEGRWSAERRALVVQKAPFGRSIAATSSSLGPVLPGAGASKLAIQVGFRPPFACPVQPLKAAPRIGHGRLPKAPRVCVCETQPRAPHRPSGCPSGQLSLCPTSGSPLEAPLTGQDASRISAVLGAGIGIHSHFRERRLLLVVPECARLGADPESSTVHRSGFRVVPLRTSSKRSPHERSDMWDCGTRTVCELIARPVRVLQIRSHDCTAMPGRTAISISIRK